MKRKSKFIPHRKDPNAERAYTAGFAARLVGKPSTACPNLLLLYAEAYATVLMDRWMAGWFDADRRQRSPRLPMEGGM